MSVDDVQMGTDKIWEPWVPVMGQRVRFNRSECPRFHSGIVQAVGVIVPCPYLPAHRMHPGHRWHVYLDPPIPTPYGNVRIVHAAAVELTPFDAGGGIGG